MLYGNKSTKKRTKKIGTAEASNHINGTLGEKSLHAQLKRWYFKSGDQQEKIVDGFARSFLHTRAGGRNQPATLAGPENSLLPSQNGRHRESGEKGNSVLYSSSDMSVEIG